MKGVAMSQDGSLIMLGAFHGVGKISSDKGASFTNYTRGGASGAPLYLASGLNTLSLAMSGDGTRAIVSHAVNSERGLYLTTDSRGSWTRVANDPAYSAAGLTLYQEVCMSPDGQTIWVGTGTATSGLIRSTDGGGSWTVVEARAVSKLACSRDGAKVAYSISSTLPVGLFTVGFL